MENMNNKEEIKKMFEYLEKNEIENEFTDSVKAFYNKAGFLTDRQVECLDEIIENHNFCNDFFSNYNDDNKFILSLQDQFLKKSYLTSRQIKCLQEKCPLK